MAEYSYQSSEAWNTSVKLATAVGRLKVGSNLKASADAHEHAFEQAGLAAALIAEATTRDGPGQVPLYRDARGALAQCRSWLQVLASLMNEPETVFGNELDLAEQASRQVNASLRTMDRPAPGGPGGAPPRPQFRGVPPPGAPRPDRPPRQDRAPR